MSAGGWIGVDLDGTLAEYTSWVDASHIGKPVHAMLIRVKAWLSEGEEVRIFTARIYPINTCVRPGQMLLFQPVTERDRDAIIALRAIQQWCAAFVGAALPVTNVKDYGMKMLYDDRCTQVESNTGRLISSGDRGAP